MICYDCLGHFKWLVEDKGFKICQACYGKRYSKWKKKKSNPDPENPTFADLKKKLERRW